MRGEIYLAQKKKDLAKRDFAQPDAFAQRADVP